MPSRDDLLDVLDRFYDAGLMPAISTNRSIADADVEVTRGPRVQGQTSAPILDVQVTAAGQARLDAAVKRA